VVVVFPEELSLIFIIPGDVVLVDEVDEVVALVVEDVFDVEVLLLMSLSNRGSR
jgi:hypothetical protein